MKKEIIFELNAKCIFQAKDIDNAFVKLSEHFTALANEKDTNLILGGEIEIEEIAPVDNFYQNK